MTMRLTAKAGEVINPSTVARVRKFTGSHVPATVQPKCAHSHGGYICIDCPNAAVMTAAVIAKMHTKAHRIAWWTGKAIEEA